MGRTEGTKAHLASVDIGANASIISSGSVNVTADGESNALANAIFFKNGASYGFTFGVNIVGVVLTGWLWPPRARLSQRRTTTPRGPVPAR